MKSRSARVWSVAFLGFLLIIAGWSFAAPYDGSPDEIDHVVRAVGVVSGEVAPPPADAKKGSGAFQTVPQGLARTNCWAFGAGRSAACAVSPDGDRTPVSAPSGAGRYFPAYYAVVGWPLTWWPGWTGVFLARLVSGAAAAALLAGAVTVIANRPRHRLMLAGLLAGFTPMAASMASAVNPNGLEIAAALAFFTGLIHLLIGGAPPKAGGSAPVSGLLWLVGLSGVALAVLRASSLLWLAVGFLAFLVPWSRTNVIPLLRRPAVWGWVAAIGVSGVAAFVWIVARNATDLGDYTAGRVLTFSQAWMVEAEKWPGYLDEAVGVTSWLDTRMSRIFYLVWELVAGALVVAAVVAGTRTDRWRMLVLAAAGLLGPAALEVRFANETGFITQGRYILPILAGLALLAAFVLGGAGLPAVTVRSAVRTAVLVFLPVHLVCLLYTMARWQRGLPEVGTRGITSLDPSRGEWHPVVGWQTPLVLEVLGLSILAVLLWVLADRTGSSSADEGAAPRRPWAGRTELSGSAARPAVLPSRDHEGPAEPRTASAPPPAAVPPADR
jgi:hypothetical protein